MATINVIVEKKPRLWSKALELIEAKELTPNDILLLFDALQVLDYPTSGGKVCYRAPYQYRPELIDYADFMKALRLRYEICILARYD